ncbi:MAG: type III-B CRISPR module-associated protein Cmr5 [Bacteroidota bacterium]|nr:type III-B CRISPR module-associated protein Cmr5 [Bacteroidota bacterium]MDE2957251.1 type III-B CRISPR module-associated protein Cmr5 [Bacteroidota bacterium]
MNRHRTLDQLRAREAWKRVTEVIEAGGGDYSKDYGREVKRLPVRIQTAGLGQALSFLYAKSKAKGRDAKSQLLADLAGWLLDHRKLAARSKGAADRSALLQAIIDGDSDFLRRATDEALKYLQWLGRFTEAEIKQE